MMQPDRTVDDVQPRIPPALRELEATRIHRAVFRQPIGAVLSARFLAAADSHNERVAAPDRAEYYAAIDAIPDLESLEVACRFAGRMPLLSQRMQLMVYLAEAAPEYQHHLVNSRTARVRGWCAVVAGAGITACKFIKGRYLLTRLPDA